MGDSTVVLTSENSAEFYAQRMNLPPLEPDVPPDEDGAAQESVEDGDSDGDASDADKGATEESQESQSNQEGKQKLHLRFSELTKARDAARAEAAKAAAELAEERAAKAQAEMDAAALRARYERPVDAIPPKPTASQYSSTEEFAQALEAWTENRVKRETEIRSSVDSTVKAWESREAKVRQERADYDDTIKASANLIISNAVRDAMIESELGPEIRYHLAKNPDLVTKLASMTIANQVKTIGRIEAQLESAKDTGTPAQATEKSETSSGETAAHKVAVTSKAPAPISPIRSNSTSSSVSNLIDSNGEFTGTPAQYRAARKAGKIK